MKFAPDGGKHKNASKTCEILCVNFSQFLKVLFLLGKCMFSHNLLPVDVGAVQVPHLVEESRRTNVVVGAEDGLKKSQKYFNFFCFACGNC